VLCYVLSCCVVAVVVRLRGDGWRERYGERRCDR
jgi:hypothetical protein